MNPAFGLVEAKALYPYFNQCSNSVSGLSSTLYVRVHCSLAQQLADKWHEAISRAESGQAAIIDVSFWFCKATLDACVRGSKATVMALIYPT